MNNSGHKISVLFFLIFCVSYVSAQNVVPLPRVIIQSSPQRPVAGSSWTLTLIINHPYPNEVTVFTPEFAESLVLEQTQIVARIVEAGGRLNRWTAAEYRFKLNVAETILFEPFTVITPGGSVQTQTISLVVDRANATIVLPKPRLVWEGTFSGLQTGQAVAVNLMVNGWDSRFSLPPPEFFMPDLVEGAIIEVQELSSTEETDSVVLCMQIIPLKPGTIVFPAQTILHENISFPIPQLRITTSAIPSTASLSATLVEENSESNVTIIPIVRFHEFQNPPLLKGFSRQRYRMASALFRSSYDACCHSAEELWDNGHYVETLALLRRREKHIFAGLLYTHLRWQAEQALTVNLADKDPPRNFFAFPWRTYQYGVLRETPFRCIPVSSSEPIGQFREGQSARISLMKKKQANNDPHTWVWAETTSHSGWIPENRVIYY